jgi:hypothetical protein
MRNRRRPRPPRVLHVPYNIAGNASGLSEGLRSLGWDSTVWTLMEDPYGFSGDRTWWDSSTPMLIRELRRLKAIIQAAYGFDVIHYNFGTTIAQPPLGDRPNGSSTGRLATRVLVRYRHVLQHAELWLMRKLGRKIFVHYQGDDARQADYQLGYEVSILQAHPDAYTSDLDAQRKRQIDLLHRYAEQFYAVNPDLMNALPTPARFLPYSHLDARRVQLTLPTADATQRLVVGHAPTHRGVKGTTRVIEAVEVLEREGHPVELRLIEGLQHREAMEAYREVDVLVDQLYAGWYGGLAVELMAMGKPVLSYIRAEDLRWVPSAMVSDIPIISVTEDTLHATLIELVNSGRENLLAVGTSGRHFAERWHDPRGIAADVASDYRRALGDVE